MFFTQLIKSVIDLSKIMRERDWTLLRERDWTIIGIRIVCKLGSGNKARYNYIGISRSRDWIVESKRWR